ncbi:winged helix-turn-helix transcriptional regulator [Leifsonia sp. AG29]|uniref:winged helix-turn-helix transcriptional regulator n=1 Tax=Leifsonia sp. AG29 TaxID=2598860 RepID=UPI00131E05D1|nr:helix-turn-helix domain-containing protein [Leifsonia sp. AG29]
MAARSPRGFGQFSGVARAVERVGERWALLIVRDLLPGARRYSDLKAGLPRIPTNILSDRLKELQEAGIIRRVPTVRGGYELTERGRELEPVVLALERWGWAELGAPAEGEVLTGDALAVAVRAAFRPEEAAGLPRTEYVLHAGGVSVSAIVDGPEVDVIAIGEAALPQPRRRLSAAAPSEVLEAIADVSELQRVLEGDGPLDVLAGGDALVERFHRTFRIEPAARGTKFADGVDESSVA